ncbi:anti-sigma factor family protein [Maritalea porphyrae]|uniref:Anti-sigma factor n=1 Tax=Maritalea porphyrae TaxID=880732 RepID=A0ABQ5UPM7_9HYPH|nr:anti-sigma factor [Maritalea porphyrae]GLQ16379.1 anti-sigma factor [Maritalea porphyrae]
MNISDDLLVAYVDGELSQAKREEVETYLAQNPEQAERVKQWQANDLALKQAFSLDDVPDVQSELPTAHNDNNRWQQLTRYALAACLLLAIGFGGGLGLSQLPFGDVKYQLRVAAWANEAHEVFATDKNRPGEFDQDSLDVATGWLQKRVGVDVSIPNLESNQLRFVGARLVGQGGLPGALMTYETASAERISVFVQAHSEQLAEVGYWFVPSEDKTTCVWLNQNIAFSVTGDMSNDDLKAIALRVRDSLGLGYQGRNV